MFPPVLCCCSLKINSPWLPYLPLEWSYQFWIIIVYHDLKLSSPSCLLESYYSNYDPWSSNLDITCGLVRNAKLQDPAQALNQNLPFNKISTSLECTWKCEKHCIRIHFLCNKVAFKKKSLQNNVSYFLFNGEKIAKTGLPFFSFYN